jgi:hypothetical protein
VPALFAVALIGCARESQLPGSKAFQQEIAHTQRRCIGMRTLLQLEPRADAALASYTEQQSDSRRHLPPALRLVPLQSEKAFFAGAARLKVELDDDRRK